jgi:hypothetical protein
MVRDEPLLEVSSINMLIRGHNECEGQHDSISAVVRKLHDSNMDRRAASDIIICGADVKLWTFHR